MKILVCGSRDWTNGFQVFYSIIKHSPSRLCENIIVHGDCRGADKIADAIGKNHKMDVRAYPAAWREFGYAAGPIRNSEMLTKEHRQDEPIDLCLAFTDDLAKSKGAADMVLKARAAGITVKVINGKVEES